MSAYRDRNGFNLPAEGEVCPGHIKRNVFPVIGRLFTGKSWKDLREQRQANLFDTLYRNW